jgi:hypothetical protein
MTIGERNLLNMTMHLSNAINNNNKSMKTLKFNLNKFKWSSSLIPVPALLLPPLSCIRASSTSANNNKNAKILNPFFVTGFSDGESCFYTKITKRKGYFTG